MERAQFSASDEEWNSITVKLLWFKIHLNARRMWKSWRKWKKSNFTNFKITDLKSNWDFRLLFSFILLLSVNWKFWYFKVIHESRANVANLLKKNQPHYIGPLSDYYSQNRRGTIFFMCVSLTQIYIQFNDDLQ
jgi:hypothetical protein